MTLSINLVTLSLLGLFLAGTGLYGLVILLLQSGRATGITSQATNQPILLISVFLILMGGCLAALSVSALMNIDAARQHEASYRPYVFITAPAIMPLADATTSD